MGFVAGLLTAFLSGVCGAVAAFVAADVGTRAQGVSSFEGERSYLIVFVLVPLGFVLGVGVGAVVAYVARSRGLAGLARQAGLAVLITCALIGAMGGLAVLAVDHPPTIEGRALFLDFEVRVPAARPPEDLAGFTASLSGTSSDNRFADLGLDKIETRDGYRVIPGSASINSHSDQRTLLIGPSGWQSQVFDVKLPFAPRKQDQAWSQWIPPRSHLDGIPCVSKALDQRQKRRLLQTLF